jgi:hypothetical protein
VVNPDGNDGNPYELNDIELELIVQGNGTNLSSGETVTKSMEDIKKPGSGTVTWRLDAVSSGNSTLRVNAGGTAYYDHSNSKYPDEYRYDRETAPAAIIVKTLSATLSQYSFSVPEGNERDFVLTLTATENLTNVTAWVPGILGDILTVNSSHGNWTGAGVPFLGENEQLPLELNLSGKRAVSRDVVFSWENSTGELQTIKVRFTVVGKGKKAGDQFPYTKYSRPLGYISAATMISLFVSGSRSPRVRKRTNRLFGNAARRVKVHCLVSYVALLTALVHAIFLMVKRETLYLDDDDVLLGYTALSLMGAVALNGIFQKWIAKKFGYRKWHLFHLLGSVVAIATAVIHILRLNTKLGFNL